MANKQSRSPGGLQEFQGRAAIGSLPDTAVDTGAAARVLESVGGSLSTRLSAMADHAAQKEGRLAGLNAGQKAGERFLEREKVSAQAKPGAAKPDLTVKPGEASTGPAGLSDQPLQLRRDNTIRGEAFDAAAIKTYGWRLQEGLANDIGAAFEANKASPGGFEAAVNKAVAVYREDGMLEQSPEIRDLFDKTLSDRLGPARMAVAANHEAAVRAAARAAAVDGSTAVLHELERNAYALGANPAANWMLQGSIERAVNGVDAAVRAGTFSAKEGEAHKARIKNTVLGARTTGTFDALPTPAAKQEFATSIMDSYVSGQGAYADLSLTEAKELSGSLFSRATAEANKLSATQKAEGARIEGLIKDDLSSLAGSGTGLDPVENGLTPDRVKTLLGEETYEAWMADRDTARRGWEATTGMEAETVAEIEARLATLAPKPGQVGYDDQDRIYRIAVKQSAAVLEERKTDPLGQAHRGGIVELKAIDTTSADALAGSLALRRQQADVVARAYGTPLTVFRPEEAASLGNALSENPELLPAFARTATETLGDLAPRAMAELSEQAPEIIQAASIGMVTGDNSVADDVARVIAGRKQGTFKVKMPTDNVLGDAAGRELGSVFGQNDQARAAVIGTANLLFEKEANTLGFDPGAVNTAGSTAAAAYNRAVNRALGSHLINGEQYGGLADVNGAAIVAPTFMPASRPEELIQSLTAADLEQLAPIASSNGIAITAGDLRNARLVTIGDGLYRVALGDPDGFDPRYVAGTDGGFWVLDLKQLETARAAVPKYSRPAPGPKR